MPPRSLPLPPPPPTLAPPASEREGEEEAEEVESGSETKRTSASTTSSSRSIGGEEGEGEEEGAEAEAEAVAAAAAASPPGGPGGGAVLPLSPAPPPPSSLPSPSSSSSSSLSTCTSAPATLTTPSAAAATSRLPAPSCRHAASDSQPTTAIRRRVSVTPGPSKIRGTRSVGRRPGGSRSLPRPRPSTTAERSPGASARRRLEGQSHVSPSSVSVAWPLLPSLSSGGSSKMSRVANGGGTPRALAAASGAKNLAAASRKPTSAESLGPWTLTAARALPCGSRDQSTASREGEGVIRSGGEREEEKEGVFPVSPFSSSSSSSSPISTLPPPPTSFPPPSADGGGGLAERAAALPRGTPGLSSVADSAGRSTLALAPPSESEA